MPRPGTRALPTAAGRETAWRAVLGRLSGGAIDDVEFARLVRHWLAERATAGTAPPTLLNDLSHIRAGLARVAVLSVPAATLLDDARDGLRRLLPDHVVRQAMPATARHVEAVERLGLTDLSLTVRLMWHLAARHADVAGLLPQDISSPRPGLVVVRYRRTKTSQVGAVRTVVGILPQRAWSHLLPRLSRGQLGLVPYAALVKGLQRVDPRLTGHSLRRGAVQALLDAQVPLPEVMRLTGHQQEDTLLRYADRPPPSALEAAPRVAEALGVRDWEESCGWRDSAATCTRSRSTITSRRVAGGSPGPPRRRSDLRSSSSGS